MAHLINQPPLWAASVFFPSLVFGYFKDRHQTVVTPFLLHAWYNAGFLVVMAAG
jgi:membrane protease YdiL (CAAX protease family)